MKIEKKKQKKEEEKDKKENERKRRRKERKKEKKRKQRRKSRKKVGGNSIEESVLTVTYGSCRPCSTADRDNFGNFKWAKLILNRSYLRA